MDPDRIPGISTNDTQHATTVMQTCDSNGVEYDERSSWGARQGDTRKGEQPDAAPEEKRNVGRSSSRSNEPARIPRCCLEEQETRERQRLRSTKKRRGRITRDSAGDQSADTLLGLPLMLLALGGAAVLSGSDALRQKRESDIEVLQILETMIPPHLYELLLSRLTSPLAPIPAIILTGASLTIYRYLHRHEKKQGEIVVGFLAVGAIIGKLAGMDGIAIALRVSPWYIILGFLASTAWSSKNVVVEEAHVDVGEKT
ncbi:hypothetical protein OQA88_7670 [Cercophora sp. LCS_1]